MRVVTIGVLGPTLVERDGAPVEAGPLRQRALLTLLALNAGRTLPLEAVVDALWDEDAPDRAEVSVRSYVSNLRRVLEPERAPRAPATLLLTSGTGYSLEVPDDAVDALRFSELATISVQAERANGAVDASTRALQCWRGPALVDVQSAPFAIGVATRLHANRDRQELVRLRGLVELGRYSEALRQLEARVDDDNADEVAVALLMRALYAVGRPAEALTRYGALRAALEERVDRLTRSATGRIFSTS